MLMEIDWNAVFRPNVIAVVMGCLIPIVGTIAWAWSQVQKTRSMNNLKRSLVERGMKVEEIERICSAGVPKDE